MIAHTNTVATLDEIEAMMARARKARADHVNFEVRRVLRAIAHGWLGLVALVPNPRHA